MLMPSKVKYRKQQRGRRAEVRRNDQQRDPA